MKHIPKDLSKNMKRFVRKPAEVMAKQLDHDSVLITDAGEFYYRAGDWLVTVDEAYWIVEGDKFDSLYEEVSTTVDTSECDDEVKNVTNS